MLNINDPDPLDVKMNADLALILITNLIKNAIVHNHPEGLINIIIKTGSLIIENTGRNSALDKQLMFTRFNKEKQSETSTGLGLAIVKAICDLYSFTINYTYNTRHVMTVNLK